MKIKKVLMFHGTDMCYNTLNIFSESVAECMRKRGIDVRFIDMYLPEDELIRKFVSVMDMDYDVAIAFNSQGQEKLDIGIPVYNWLVDHPAEHLPSIKETIDNYNVICIDRDHVNYVRRYFPNVSNAVFCPLGGERIEDDIDFSFEAFENRRYDVIFTGSYTRLNDIAHSIESFPENLSGICRDLIEVMLDNPMVNTEKALAGVLRDRNIEYDRNSFPQYMFAISKATFYLRSYLREQIVRYLADSDLTVEIFGKGWEDLGEIGNIRVHGPISHYDSVSLCKEARISLNVMPLFKDGLHDRIPTAMLQGAAAMTDTSSYIEETFDLSEEKGEIILYDIGHPEMIADKIRTALDDRESLYAMASRGRIKAEQSLTWDKRVEEVINKIEDHLIG